MLALFVGTVFLMSPPAAQAQSKKQCSKSCKGQKKGCDKGFKKTSKEAKKACGKDKQCKKQVKKDLKQDRKQCKKQSKVCSKCCKQDPAGECTIIGPGINLCGNAVVEPGEGCDAGNANANDPGAPCRENCQPAMCGDGILDPNEACDNGPANDDAAPDACRTDCRAARCGDAVTDTGEECDQGDPSEFPPNVANNDTRPDACRLNCVNPECGDRVVDTGESCDDGADNSDTTPDACRTNCDGAGCGDGVIDSVEQCDDGAANSNTTPGACREDCRNSFCGDGVVDPGEQCDGNPAPGCDSGLCRASGASACTCVAPGCGNGVVEPDLGETCEPGVDESACLVFECLESCECFVPSRLAFTTVLPGGECGRVNSAVDGTGIDLTPYPGGMDFLECGGLYIGGGISVQPPSPTPDNATTVLKVIDASDATAVRLGPITKAETGSDRNCSAANEGCFFGPPLPIPNASAPAVSTCVFNVIDKRATGEEVSGTLDATTGATTVTLPLTVKVHVTGDLEDATPGIQPCPTCQGPVGARTCRSGQRVNSPCSTSNVLGTTHDCPPLSNTSLPNFGVDLTPLTTGRAVKAGPGGDFCTSTTGQRTLGCFGTNSGSRVCQYIEENGCPFYIDPAPGQPAACVATGADDLTTAGGDLRAIQASVFCIPSSGNMLVDTVADLPGPGAVTLTGVNKIE
jgi:hypothetical protein